MWQSISRGGPMMIPIVLCSLLALTVIIERMVFFLRLRMDREQVIADIYDKVRKNRVTEAIELCEKKPFYITNILKAGLLRHDEAKEIIREAMEDASLYEVPKLERNIHFLSTIAHIAPLLGLLGSVVGLIDCFRIIDARSVTVGVIAVSDLAKGIWSALIATAASLCVAIPGYIAYHYFVHKVDLCVLEAERASAELLEVLNQRHYSAQP